MLLKSQQKFLRSDWKGGVSASADGHRSLDGDEEREWGWTCGSTLFHLPVWTCVLCNQLLSRARSSWPHAAGAEHHRGEQHGKKVDGSSPSPTSSSFKSFQHHILSAVNVQPISRDWNPRPSQKLGIRIKSDNEWFLHNSSITLLSGCLCTLSGEKWIIDLIKKRRARQKPGGKNEKMWKKCDSIRCSV